MELFTAAVSTRNNGIETGVSRDTNEAVVTHIKVNMLLLYILYVGSLDRLSLQTEQNLK